jgi:F420-0:gamma-glutamyl ligase-like protein
MQRVSDGFLIDLDSFTIFITNMLTACLLLDMLWGEILANLILGVMTWLYLKDVVKTT